MSSELRDHQSNAVATRDEVIHLAGKELPDIAVPVTTAPEPRSLRDLARSTARLVVYAYPSIGAPDREPITSDWKSIPGAFGCTAESCGFRDLAATLGELGAGVCGLSTQSPDEQEEAAQRLALGFPLLSDRDHAITGELRLPVWSAGGPDGPGLLKRFTMVTDGTVIQHVFAPVPDPATHAADVVAWLRENPR
ncbi:peroxiredoxin [Amycolatopsis pigmentata]|uniref:thioredoxin-dependent peroxiredoxin n=1 Tax=Amycolatopsis pigmentata TaxID=450801 RepID=A0ABW5FNN5_9PSEU